MRRNNLNGAGTFNRGRNAGTRKCRSCKRTKQLANIDMGTELCDDGDFSCYEISGQENAHLDGVHAHWDKCPDNCPYAHRELFDVMDGKLPRPK